MSDEKSTMVDKGGYRPASGEYVHAVLSPGLHFGRHSRYGRHVAIGDGANALHIYSHRIHIGGRGGRPVYLTPEQSMVAERLLARFESMAEAQGFKTT